MENLERCPHELNEDWYCKHCGGSYWVIKNDPRPWSVIKQERLDRKNNQSNTEGHKPNIS